MNKLVVTVPQELPGVDVAYVLKQCLGKTDLLQGLLHRFWDDYENSWDELKSLNGSTEQQSWILHNVRGVAGNLGLNDLTTVCGELKQDLINFSHLGEEPIRRYHIELEKVGGSIKKLDSLL